MFLILDNETPQESSVTKPKNADVEWNALEPYIEQAKKDINSISERTSNNFDIEGTYKAKYFRSKPAFYSKIM